METTSTHTLGFLLHDAARLLRRRFEGRGTEYGLSSAQWRLMVHVVRQGGGISQARLAELLEIEPISVSRLVDRMAQGGWVERSPDPQDRRVRLIHPTGRALDAFATVKALAGEVYEEALTGLAPDQRAALMSGLATIVANLGGMDDGPAACRRGEGKGTGQ